MNLSYRLVPFGGDAVPPVQDLVHLHKSLLPTSPVTLLGDRFMQRFYYWVPPRENVMCGAVAYVENQSAGFVTATTDSTRWMRRALARHWLYLGWLVATSILPEPKRAVAVWEASRIMISLPSVEKEESVGEILSLGVLPAYQEPRFVRESGLKISTDLLQNAVAQLCARGVRKIRVIVDKDNMAAKLFYSALGWTLDHPNVPGWRTPSVGFSWRP